MAPRPMHATEELASAVDTHTYTLGDPWLIALLCSVAAVGAALWYNVWVSRAADDVDVNADAMCVSGGGGHGAGTCDQCP